jgi:DNA-binding CsgD family transcriptional regulator
LSLLAAAADDRPVLAVVDDLQWIDAPSREALLFAARRLDGERVIMLIAGRDCDAEIDSSGVDELALSGLDRDAAAELLEGRLGHRGPPHLLDRLMEATGGNPLGLFELASGFSETPGGSGQGSRRSLPAATTVERAFLRRIGGLPAPTRYGLVVLAADSGVRPIVLEACALLGLPDGCLQAAEDAGVIRVEGDRIAFTHPLLRAAVYRAAPELTRERVHRTLRRTSRGADARTYLRSALQTFDRLGARPWGNRARNELATTGETTRPEPRNDLSELTPQELQMALIVGQGATNKEASAALFISPKTVEAHLHRIYVKLGIRSRTELAGLLARAHMLGD